MSEIHRKIKANIIILIPFFINENVLSETTIDLNAIIKKVKIIKKITENALLQKNAVILESGRAYPIRILWETPNNIAVAKKYKHIFTSLYNLIR